MTPWGPNVFKHILARKLVYFARNKFIFSGHTFWLLQSSIINIPLVNSILCLANKWVTHKFTWIVPSFSFMCVCDGGVWINPVMRWDIILGFSNCSNLFSCELGTLWWALNLVMLKYILLAQLKYHCIVNIMLWHIIV